MKTGKIVMAVVLVGVVAVIGTIYFLNAKNTSSIAVISPASGDVLSTGSIYKIKWTTQNIPAANKISISIRRVPPPPLQTEGQEFDPIITTNLPNTGSFDWTVAGMYPPGNYVLGLASYASLPVTNPISAESAEFTINKTIGGQRDDHGCLTPAGYAFNESVGACIRAFEMTADIMKAAKIAVDSIGRNYALTVVSFNSYEELGAYDIMFEKGMERTKQTVYIKNWKVQGAESGIQCHDSAKYFAIEQSLVPNAGSNMLIKYKTNSGNNFPCVYTAASRDFELKNLAAEYFLAFTDSFLLLDKGTAPPPRELVVYDLRARKIAFTDFYTKPVAVSGDVITYFSKTSKKPTLANCPRLNDYTSNGLGAVVMSKVTVDLNSLDKKYLGLTECLATQ